MKAFMIFALVFVCVTVVAVPVSSPDNSVDSLEGESLFEQVRRSGIAQLVKFDFDEKHAVEMKSAEDSPYLPVVQMHGMGDFADNPLGMVPLKKAISKELSGTYVTNVALGKTENADIMGSFIKIMSEEVDIFAQAVQKDSNLTNGFNAIGYSQGNLIIRGYIEKYNSPPVKNFISIHGPMMGVAGFPRCDFKLEICKLFDNFLGAAAYNELSQHILAQTNYYRDPLRIPGYLKHNIWLPEINNENSANATSKANFASLNKLVCVKALKDTMIWPRESEWWGFYKDGSDTDLEEMEDSAWYQKDLFGLKTLVQAGKYDQYTTEGNHLQFNETFLLGLVDKYLK